MVFQSRQSQSSNELTATGRLRNKRVACLGILLIALALLYLVLAYRRGLPGFRPFADGPYFPESSSVSMRIGYSSRVLEAMREPSLWKASQRGDVAAYRFLCVSSAMGQPFGVRVTRTAHGAELRAVELAGVADSRRNRIQSEKTLPLSLAQWADIDSMANRADFWALPSENDRVISDGTAMIVEGVRGSLYHVVHRQSPSPGSFQHLCEYLFALTGPDRDRPNWEREPRSVGLGRFALVKSRKHALALRFLEHTQVGAGGSDYNGATYEWFLQADGSGDFTRDSVKTGKSEVVGDPNERWDNVPIRCGPFTLAWSQCYLDCDYLRVRRAECDVDRFDVVAIAVSDWSKVSEVQVDDKYLNWSVGE